MTTTTSAMLHTLRAVGVTVTRSEATPAGGWVIEATRARDGHVYTIGADDEYHAAVTLAELEGFDLEE